MVRDSHISGCPEYLRKDLAWLNINREPLSRISSASNSSCDCVPKQTVCAPLSIVKGKIGLTAFSGYITQQINCGQGGCSHLKCFFHFPEGVVLLGQRGRLNLCFHGFSDWLVFLAIKIPRQLIGVMVKSSSVVCRKLLHRSCFVSSSSIVCRKLFDKSCFPFQSRVPEKLLEVDFQASYSFNFIMSSLQYLTCPTKINHLSEFILCGPSKSFLSKKYTHSSEILL